jgi:mannose-1-phosphate guanylyltransferase/phosphomannomutase
MELVIIAGGKGTRLGRSDLPKPMIPVLGKPILEYQIELAKKYGIKDIFILSGYLSSSITDYFGDGAKWGVKINHVVEKTAYGTAGALKQLEGCVKSRFMVFYGDTLIDVNLKRMIAYDKSKFSLGTLLVHPNDHPFDSDLIKVDETTNEILKIFTKPHIDIYKPNLVNAALYILSSDIFKFIPDNCFTDLATNTFPNLLNQGLKLFAYPSAEYIKDMGTPNRLKQVELDLKSGKVSRFNCEYKRKALFIDRDGVINKEIGNLSNIDDFELLPGVAEAIKNINNSDFLAIIITNQPVVAKGFCSLEELHEIHYKLHFLLGSESAYVDKIYFCPHHPEVGFKGEVKSLKVDCNCRKPKIGLIEKAVEEYNIDIGNSYFIGDTTTDLLTGNNAGLKTILVRTGFSGNDKKFNIEPNFEVDSLMEAVNLVLDLE